MDIKRKIELTEQHVRFISRADDTDVALRAAALDRVAQVVAAERKAMNARLAERIAAEIGGAAASAAAADGAPT